MRREIVNYRVATLVALFVIACGDSSSGSDGEGTGETGSGSAGDASSGSAGDGEQPEVELEPPPSGWTRHVVDARATGPAFSVLGDVNEDGKVDLITGHLGLIEGSTPPPGRLTAYLQGDGVGDWSIDEVFGTDAGLNFPNDATVTDLDGDGDMDVIAPLGFLVCNLFNNPCGGLVWFEQADGQWVRHDIVTPPTELFYHIAILQDMDADGIDDLVTVGEFFDAEKQGAEVQWFKGIESAERFSSKPRKIGDGGGSLPELVDVDQDGDLDVISAEFFVEGSTAAWFEQKEAPSEASPDGVWERHLIDGEHGPAIQLRVIEDFLGDGKRYAVVSNHTSIHRDEPASGVFLYEIPEGEAVTQPWEPKLISDGIEAEPDDTIARNAAPGIFNVGDVDADGDLDLLVSGDGDPDTYVLEQQEDGTFATTVFQTNLPQAGSTHIVDLDGNGTNEIVLSGYEAGVVLVYERQ